MWFRGFELSQEQSDHPLLLLVYRCFCLTTNCEQRHRSEYQYDRGYSLYFTMIIHFNHCVEAVSSSCATRNRAYNCWLETTPPVVCPLKHKASVQRWISNIWSYLWARIVERRGKTLTWQHSKEMETVVFHFRQHICPLNVIEPRNLYHRSVSTRCNPRLDTCSVVCSL